jgi:Tfp pilus assembly protein PilF
LDSYGWVLYQLKRYPEAETYLERALGTQEEEDSVVFEHMAVIKQVLGKESQAHRYWEKVLKLEPNNEKAKQALKALDPSRP